MSEYVLRMEGISKEFPGVKALDNIHLNLKKGEIHALIGENGAGKSTLIKILAGIYKPDGGEIYINDKKVVIDDVSASKKMGISIIHQELSLAKNMTIAENIFLGNFPVKGGFAVDDRRMNEEAEKYLGMIGMEQFAPDMKVASLSIAQQQMVEICRSLAGENQILVLDEPTTSLITDEVERLMGIMRMLKAKGVAIIFVSHKLNEIFEISDNITILRDGRYVATEKTSEMNTDRLISMMVGREIQDIYPPHVTNVQDVFFEANNIVSDRVHDVSFNLRRGEILGFYGLMGAGRSEIMRALLGIDKASKGDILLEGKKIHINTPRDAMEAGIVLSPEDRRHEGLILKQTVDFNITLPLLGELIKGIKLNKKKKDEILDVYAKRLRIKTSSYENTVGNLSGGNQQKVVLAKWMATNPKILILDEPTKGIDVGAKQEIYKLVYEIVNMGVGVIFISSEMPEVINLCDRIYMVYEGKINGEISRDEISETAIMKYTIGGNENE